MDTNSKPISATAFVYEWVPPHQPPTAETPLPVIISTNPVAIRGKPLRRPLLWQGRRWAVTAYGVEARDGTYFIDKARLYETQSWVWEMHLSQKRWVDIEDFRHAYAWARCYFARRPK
jgi:hypothetical protein